MQTGDSSHLNNGWKNYWRPYYKLNSELDTSKKIIPIGIDFNRPANYVKALKLLLPKSLSNEIIKNDIELIKNANDTLNNCDYILDLNSKLEKSLQNNRQEYIRYFGENFKIFETIIMEKGTCNDAYKNRNYNLAANFLIFDAETNIRMYYGE